MSGSSTQKQLQLNQRKHKQLPPQYQLPTLTHDNQIKPAHYLVKHETVLLSQMEDCHPILAEFRSYQFSLRNIDEAQNSTNKPLDSFFVEAVKPIQSQKL